MKRRKPTFKSIAEIRAQRGMNAFDCFTDFDRIAEFVECEQHSIQDRAEALRLFYDGDDGLSDEEEVANFLEELRNSK